MRIASRGKSSPYEVRCPRCDVSFPVETRTCIHCGGPTAEAGAFFAMDDPAELVAPLESSGASTRPSSIEPETGADSPFGGIGESIFGESTATHDDAYHHHDAHEADHAHVAHGEYGDDRSYEGEHGPPSFVQSLMRSMGSLIWIVILIAFSLSRSCGN